MCIVLHVQYYFCIFCWLLLSIRLLLILNQKERKKIKFALLIHWEGMVDQDILSTQESVKIETEYLKDLGDYALGLKLLIKCLHSTVIGVCQHVIHNSREIILEQVSDVKTGVRRIGLVIIFYHDVITVHILGVNKKARERLWKELYQDDKRAQTTLMRQILPPSLCDDIEEGFSHLNQMKLDSQIPLLPKFKCTLVKPTDWKIVSAFGDHYNIALHEIKQESVVSVYACGRKLGRRGTLAWLCFEAGSIVYLFDVAQLGVDTLIKSEIGAIFCDEAKVKIVHNGRKLEDFLYHRFKVNMTNVFDTQASDIYLDLVNERKKATLLVKSLPTLLQEYLQMSRISMAELFPKIREEEESMWFERPLPEGLVVFLVHSVIFLRDLRQAMLKRILVNLDHINGLFLASLRDKPSAFVDDIEEQIIPPQIQAMFKESLVSKSFKINYKTLKN